MQHVIDHIIARQHGGQTIEANLALSCVHCNRYKGPNIAGMDPESQLITRLFHPRRDRWEEHLRYDEEVLVGKTDVGRVTIVVLAANRPLRLAARRSLLAEGIKLE